MSENRYKDWQKIKIKNTLEAMKQQNTEAREGFRIYDGLQLANDFNVLKYIDKKGRCRIDLDLDDFKQIFDDAEFVRLSLLLWEMCRNGHELPEQLEAILQGITMNKETSKICSYIMKAEPLFDYRKKE